MCGIAGIIGAEDPMLVTRMLEVLRHRGPDDIGIYTDDGFTLGQTRLSIIDVTGGHQPIEGDRGTSCIAVNGEIYNYRMLARSLEGHEFSTAADSEVALHLYEDLGAEMPTQLDGMFALAVYRDGEVLLARDPLGIKPLYYAIEGEVVYFASEMKALFQATDQVRVFPPGTLYVHGKGFQRFWRLPQAVPDEAVSAEAAGTRIRELLGRAVEKRLMADVPLGTFLSGGVDSTIVTALVSRSLPRVMTFATGMEGSPDLDFSQRASEHLGTDHHLAVFDEDDVLDHLSRVVYHLESLDAALLRSAIPTYFVSQLARRHVKVALLGEGSDELFAGYRYLRELPGPALHRELLRITAELHHLNLQRADRMTMAHSLEGRVPFLDKEMAGYALGLPTSLKLREEEKWILREAFRELLPDFLLHRSKMKFAEGTGSSLVVKEAAERELSDAEFERLVSAHPRVPLRTKEEAYLFKIFREFFPQESALQAVGRTWTY